MHKKSHLSNRIRCAWVGDDPLMQHYHDTVWGIPTHDDREIFKAIVLDTHQAGLSWQCILHKADNFAKAFHNFDPKKIARMSARDVVRLMRDPGIIRHRGKIQGCITNAQKFLDVQKEFGSFAKYIWSFTGGKSIVGSPRNLQNYRSHSSESIAMSKDLKKRGFIFVGPTTCYAFMQGIGMVQDHMVTCWKFKKKNKL